MTKNRRRRGPGGGGAAELRRLQRSFSRALQSDGAVGDAGAGGGRRFRVGGGAEGGPGGGGRRVRGTVAAAAAAGGAPRPAAGPPVPRAGEPRHGGLLQCVGDLGQDQRHSAHVGAKLWVGLRAEKPDVYAGLDLLRRRRRRRPQRLVHHLQALLPLVQPPRLPGGSRVSETGW